MVEQVFDAQVDLVQHQRRGATLLIQPDDDGIAHHHARLVQQPVGQIVVCAACCECDAADKNMSKVVAAYQQFRAVNFQTGQAQFGGQQG